MNSNVRMSIVTIGLILTAVVGNVHADKEPTPNDTSKLSGNEVTAEVENKFHLIVSEKKFTEAMLIANQFAPDLTRDRKDQWISSVHKALLPDCKVVVELDDKEFDAALQCVAALNDVEGMALLLKDKRLIESHNPKQFGMALNQVERIDKNARSPLETILCDNYEKAYLTGNQIESENISEVMDMGRRLAGTILADRKAVWRDLLRSRFVKDGELNTNLSPVDIPQVTGFMVILGDRSGANWAGAWLKKNWDQVSLDTVISLYSGNPMSSGSPEKVLLAHYVYQYLIEDKKIADVVVNKSAQAAGLVADSLDVARKKSLAKTLMDRYASDKEAIASLRSRDIGCMVAAMCRLDCGESAAMLLENNAAWPRGRMSEYADLFAAIGDMGRKGQPLRFLVCDHFEKNYLSQSLPPENMVELAKVVKGMAEWFPRRRQEALSRKLENLYRRKDFLASLDVKGMVSAVEAAVSLKSVDGVRAILTSNNHWSPEFLIELAIQIENDDEKLGEVGIPLREFLALRAKTVIDTIKTPSQLHDAASFAAVAIFDIISSEDRIAISANLIERLAKDNQAIAILSDEQYMDLISALVGLEASSDARKLLVPERLSKLDLMEITCLGVILGKHGEKEGSPLRFALFDHVSGALQKVSATDMPLLAKFYGMLSHDAIPSDKRREWAKALRTAMSSEKIVLSMNIESFVAFTDIMNDPSAAEVFTPWMKTNQWKSGDITNLLKTLSRKSYFGVQNDSEDLRKIIDHLITGYLSDDECTRRLSLDTWEATTRRLSGIMNESQRQLAVRSFIRAFAGDMGVFSNLKSQNIIALKLCMQSLGRGDIASLLSEAHSALINHPGHSRDQQPEGGEAVVGLVLNQVALAEAEDRQRVWAVGQEYISKNIDQFSERLFEIIDGFVGAMESDSTLAEEIITNLAKRTPEEQDTLSRLKRHFESFAFHKHIQEAKPSIREAFQRAQQFVAEGKWPEATVAYRAILESEECPDTLKNGLCRRILALLLEQPTDLAALDKYLPALQRQGEEFDVEAWNLTCRVLFRQVALAKRNRIGIWEKGLDDLRADNIVISEKTFKDLDTVKAFLVKEGGKELAETIMADLLLLTPDRYSMRRLQWRRIASFVEARDWNNAQAAAAMDVVLAAASCQDIASPIERYMEILRSSGLPESKVADAIRSLLIDVPEHNKASDSKNFFDEPLKKAAMTTIDKIQTMDTFRRIAYLNLLAGHTDNAISVTKECLTKPNNPSINDIVPADMYVMLSVTDGRLASTKHFMNWLPRGEKASAAQAFCSQWAPAMNLSAVLAAGKNNKSVAGWIYALTLLGSDKTEDINVAIDSITQTQKVQGDLPDARLMLKSLLPFVPKLPHRRIILVKMAGLAHEEELDDDCLALLKEADAISSSIKEKDFTAVILKSSLMLGSEDFDGAGELLAKAVTWDGADENKAQCMFLMACLELKQGQLDEACEILQKLISQYPRTAASVKGRQIAARLQRRTNPNTVRKLFLRVKQTHRFCPRSNLTSSLWKFWTMFQS